MCNEYINEPKADMTTLFFLYLGVDTSIEVTVLSWRALSTPVFKMSDQGFSAD